MSKSDQVPLASGIPMSDGPVPVVQGIALTEGALGMDAVPLIDASTASILGQVNAFTIVQRTQLTEMMGCCERSNIYDIFDASNGVHLFFAKERSGFCEKQLVRAPTHTSCSSACTRPCAPTTHRRAPLSAVRAPSLLLR